MATVTASVTGNTSSTQLATLVGTVTPAAVQQSLGAQFQTSGTAADAVDLNYVATLSLAATPTTLDLTSLTDRYGAAVNFARVRSITILNKSTTNGQTIIVSPGASNGWTNLLGTTTSTLILGPSTATNPNGGALMITNPSTTGWVVDGTHKTIKLDPSASTISCAIEINGASV